MNVYSVFKPIYFRFCEQLTDEGLSCMDQLIGWTCRAAYGTTTKTRHSSQTGEMKTTLRIWKTRTR